MPEENFWTLWCKGRLTEAGTPTIRMGATPSGLTSAHLQSSTIPIFLPAGCPSCRPTNSVNNKSEEFRYLTTGCFSSQFKKAVVSPLLKKSGLDASHTKNYRPSSSLSFLSKLLDKVAQNRLHEFHDSSGLMPETRSAYRRYRSTETAVTKVYNDLLLA